MLVRSSVPKILTFITYRNGHPAALISIFFAPALHDIFDTLRLRLCTEYYFHSFIFDIITTFLLYSPFWYHITFSAASFDITLILSKILLDNGSNNS